MRCFLSGDAALLALAVAGRIVGDESLRAAPLVYGGALAISAAMLVGAARRAPRRRARARRSSCRSGCRGSARISASTRSRRSFLSSSISAAPRLASTALATAGHEHAPERVLPFFPAFLAGHESRARSPTTPTRFLLVVGVHVDRVVGAGDGPPSRGRQRARRLTSIS